MSKETHYVRDGSSRLVSYNTKTDQGKRTLGNKKYELSNHLGNVLSVISDNKIGIDNVGSDGVADSYEPYVVSESDYYPYGMIIEKRSFANADYRYGINGQEKSNEFDEDGNSYTAEFWQYSSVIARRWNSDPIFKHYESSYATFANNPINFIDINGADTLSLKGENGGVISYVHSSFPKLTLNIDGNFENTTITVPEANPPDAIGYTLSYSASAETPAGQVNASASYTNFVIYTRGEYAWQPFRYGYGGTQAGPVWTAGLASAGLTATFSPFIAWNDVKGKKAPNSFITPESWTGAFIDASISVSGGEGIIGGGSVSKFTSPDYSQTKTGWNGYSVGFNIGLGGTLGVPAKAALTGGASYYVLLESNPQKTSDLSLLKTISKWSDFTLGGFAIPSFYTQATEFLEYLFD